MEKPSAYLVGKCEGLAKVIDFFASNHGSKGRTIKDKRIVFLSQIDFWDWEMDELAYSVKSFTERSGAWESYATVQANLTKLGLPIDPGILYKIESDRGWHVYDIGKNQVVAPIDMLNEVIKKWNNLLKICETTLFMDMQEIVSFGLVNSGYIKNLDKYKKNDYLK